MHGRMHFNQNDWAALFMTYTVGAQLTDLHCPFCIFR